MIDVLTVALTAYFAVASPEPLMDGCDYIPETGNSVDPTLEDIVVIMKPGGGYKYGDVIFKFKQGALFYEKDTEQPYRVLGDIKQDVIKKATKLLPLLRSDCKKTFPRAKL